MKPPAVTTSRPLACKNEAFLDSAEARPLRILAEYIEPMQVFLREHIHDTIVFFGSARLAPDGPLGRYYAEARELARLVTAWSKSLGSRAYRYIVCTGGGGGIMEAANRGASEAGGRTIGLNIGLPHEQRPNPYITRGLSFEFHYFFMRKLWFAHLARALVVFPGGFGTLDELTEILTLSQTRKLEPPGPDSALRVKLSERDHQLRRARASRHDQPRRSRPLQIRRRSAFGAPPVAGGDRGRAGRADAVLRAHAHIAAQGLALRTQESTRCRRRMKSLFYSTSTIRCSTTTMYRTI